MTADQRRLAAQPSLHDQLIHRRYQQAQAPATTLQYQPTTSARRQADQEMNPQQVQKTQAHAPTLQPEAHLGDDAAGAPEDVGLSQQWHAIMQQLHAQQQIQIAPVNAASSSSQSVQIPHPPPWRPNNKAPSPAQPAVAPDLRAAHGARFRPPRNQPPLVARGDPDHGTDFCCC